MANILILVLTFALIFESFGIRVKVTYKSMHDELRFATTDTSICSRYNARYLETSFNEVICRCNNKQSFFGINGESPACRDENSGKLDGKKSEISLISICIY